MANKDAPDERLSPDEAEYVSRFRAGYRELSVDEKILHHELKVAYAEVELLIMQLNDGGYRALALTALEESYLWAAKEFLTNS
jgi:hypothetical protein